MSANGGRVRDPARRRRAGVGDLTDELIGQDQWTDEMVARAGLPIIDVPIVSVGGGLGSFAFADVLRIAGLPTSDIRVLTRLEVPHGTYKRLARNSQIPDHERLRSDAGSVMDNIWGWPSYALREAAAARSVRGALAPLLQVATEPVLADFYTPRAGQVYRSLGREAERIGWPCMLAPGQVRMVRRRRGGAYFTVLTPARGTAATKRVAYRSWFVHLGIGYPGLRFLPDLQSYRERTGDYAHVVNAYEPHDHVYEELVRRPATVIVRGSGIVGMRILQRLIEDIEQRGARTTIVHLFRTYVDGSHGPSVFLRRKGGSGFAYQGFNWPKASWGGQLKDRLERLDAEGRAALLMILGGTNTPPRKQWEEALARARKSGAYRAVVGKVEDVRRDGDGSIVTQIALRQGGSLSLAADYIIDATGLEGAIRDHRVLDDLLKHSGAGENALGRLDVERSFEIRGTRSGQGRMYASGSVTLGGYYAGVDSFLGLQYAALTICDDLARLGVCGRIGARRSVSQWWRWARNLPPDGSGR